MSKKKHLSLRFTSALLCMTILTGGMAANWTPIRDIPVSAKTLAELQEERKSNEKKIAEKQKELDSLQSDLEEKEAYQKTLQEKITLQQSNLDIVSQELDRIAQSLDETTQAISQAEDDIKVMEADIAIGLDEFKMRLRAMYVQGNDSLASALVGATDFYDLLSKYEYDGDNAPIIRGSALGGLNGEPAWEDKIMELMDAVDNYIPIPQRENEKPFLMPVEDVFSITGRGTVVTGRIETGVIHVGDPVEIIGLEEKTLTSTCTGVEMFRKLLDEGEAGDNVGLLLRGIDKKEVKRGMVVAKPGSITPHTKFQAEVYILKKEEGGRHTPFHNKYRPQFYLRTMDVTGEVTLPEGVDMVMPGDHVTITVELIYPVALNEGLRFAIREGGRTVGAGQILKILA